MKADAILNESGKEKKQLAVKYTILVLYPVTFLIYAVVEIISLMIFMTA